MTPKRPEERLERVLDGFSHELVAATDEEVLAAAAELEIQPMMEDPTGVHSLFPVNHSPR